MTFWFFLLGIPLAALGFTAVFRPSLAAKAMVAFPRNRVAAVVLSLLFMVFAAMMKTGLTMVMGSPVARHEPLPKRLAAVPFVLLVLLAVPALAVCVGLVVGLVPEGGWL